MTSKPPTKPPAGGKPFLGDEDLVSELDAWDATFDALHETGGDAGAEPMAWPTPQPQVKADAPKESKAARSGPITISSTAPSPVVDELPAEVPAEPVDPKRIPASTRSFDAPGGAGETDFSEVGGNAGRPAALGDLLGQAPSAYMERTTADATPLIDDDADEVFTSASRAAPPTTVAPAPTAAAPNVRKPAIIRRTAGAIPAQLPPVDDDPGATRAEPTRVASIAEMEAQRALERAAEPRSKTQTTKPPMTAPAVVSEDDYADIEMVADEKPGARTANRARAPARRPRDQAAAAQHGRAVRATGGARCDLAVAAERPGGRGRLLRCREGRRCRRRAAAARRRDRPGRAIAGQAAVRDSRARAIAGLGADADRAASDRAGRALVIGRRHPRRARRRHRGS
jgi:hypothetical protein